MTHEISKYTKQNLFEQCLLQKLHHQSICENCIECEESEICTKCALSYGSTTAIMTFDQRLYSIPPCKEGTFQQDNIVAEVVQVLEKGQHLLCHPQLAMFVI